MVEVVFSAEKARERGWRKKDTRVNSPRMFKGEDKVTTCTTSVSLTFGISKREMKTKKENKENCRERERMDDVKKDRVVWPATGETPDGGRSPGEALSGIYSSIVL